MLAFGVKPQNVRFVATSATIGQQGDPETKAGLRRFLSQVAGIPETQVLVIEGLRKIPTMPAVRHSGKLPSEETLEGLNPEELFDTLGSAPDYLRGFAEITRGPLPLKRWCEAVGAADDEFGTAILRAGAKAEKLGERLLPLRIHAFHRAQPGAWACLNPSCDGRKGTPLDSEAWAFGTVHLERSDLCPDCASPMLEVKHCSNCGQVSLAAQKNPDVHGREWLTLLPSDEEDDDFFSPLEGLEQQGFESEGESDGKSEQPRQEFVQESRKVLVVPAATPSGSIQYVNSETGEVLDQVGDRTTKFRIQGNQLLCPYCGGSFTPSAAKLLSVRIGAPFLLGSIVPELLDDALEAPKPKLKGKPDTRLRPADGRVVLMFTDSRQGTARLSAKLQRDAEQNHIRAFLYHLLQANGSGCGDEERQRLEAEIDGLTQAAAVVPSLATMLSERRRALAELDQPKPVKWDSMVQIISQDERINRFIREQVWEEREPDFANPVTFARFLLLREFLRQPVRGNSVETMGLAALRFEQFESLREDQVPQPFSSKGGSLQDWRDLLYVAMTRFARQNWCASVQPNIRHWISHRRNALKIITPPGMQPTGDNQIGWPSQSRPAERRHLVRLLAQGLALCLDSPGDRDDLDQCLLRAWSHFVGICEPAENGYRLAFEKGSLSTISRAFACPIVPGLLRDHAFRGLSPFARTTDAGFLRAEEVKMPTLPFPFDRGAGAPATDDAVAHWLDHDPDVLEDAHERGLVGPPRPHNPVFCLLPRR